jgi:hypothetical protein
MAIDWHPGSELGVAQLRVQTDKYLGGEQGHVFATLRIHTVAGLWRKRLALPIGGGDAEITLDVPPGDYSLQAVLPSGETISESGNIKKGELGEACLRWRSSQHEWLSWASYAMDASYLQPVEPLVSDSPGFESVAESALALPRLRDDWMNRFRCWGASRNQPRKWSAVNISPFTVDEGDGRYAARFNFEFFVKASLPPDIISNIVLAEVPISEDESIHCWLPLEWKTKEDQLADSLLIIDFAPGATRTAGMNPALRARSTVLDGDLAQLVGYRRQGEMEALKGISEQMADMAEEHLLNKIRNPLLAAAAAHALLNMRELDRLHDWTFNLANWFPWLPDGPIIRAWHLLYRQGQEPSSRVFAAGVLDQPRAWLLEAASRGLPVYTESLKLLVQGLRIFSNGPADPAVATALNFYEQLLWRTQSQQGFTSVRVPKETPFNPLGPLPPSVSSRV